MAVGAPFRYFLRVRYIECDAQKVVFNSRYSEYVDVGINEFLRAAGVLSDFISGPLDFQLVKQTIEWKAPARFDQVLELRIAALRLAILLLRSAPNSAWRTTIARSSASRRSTCWSTEKRSPSGRCRTRSAPRCRRA